MSAWKKTKYATPIENPTKVFCKGCNDMVPKDIKISKSEKNLNRKYFGCDACKGFIMWVDNSTYYVPEPDHKETTPSTSSDTCPEWQQDTIAEIRRLNSILQELVDVFKKKTDLDETK